MSDFAKEVNKKKVLVFGLGLQGGGLGDALWLHKHGAVVRITDKKSESELSDSLKQLPSSVELSLGGHRDNDIEWADMIIKNPGVPDDHDQLIFAKSLGKPIYTSIAITVAEDRDKVIGVTGTRGKSTTTKLIYELLNSVYPGQVEMGGNIPGTSGLTILDKLDSLKYLVLELSSFQLHNFHELHISPHVAVITNMYPDHLNRYKDMDEYFMDKSAITKYQLDNDYVIYNHDNEFAVKLANFSNAQKMTFSGKDVPSTWQFSLIGAHNYENIAAVLGLSRVLSINIDAVEKVVKNFHGLPFRLEKRRTVGGVTYINDTTSTTPTSTIKAIESINAPLVMIIGGADKKLPIDELVSKLAKSNNVKKLILLGSKEISEFTDKLKAACGSKISGQVFSMNEAVQLAQKLAEPGWSVILSPGFFSFDLFKNEFDRGRQFNSCVEQLQ